MAVRVCVCNLGCKVNRVESDWMESAFVEAGCVLVSEADAQIVAVNTCAVTGEAQGKTRKAVRHAAGLPQRPLVAVTGCVANLFPEELEALAPNVRVFPNKQSLATEALAAFFEGCGNVDTLLVPEPCAVGTPSTASHGAFRSRRGVKVQDGCDNRCTYCIVWRARGASRSVDMASIESQVAQVLREGADEVVLSGINLGRFCTLDETGRTVDLGGLIDRVCAMGARSVRVGSVEPPDVRSSLVDALVRNASAVCAHLHLPLQSGSNSVLGRMGRRYSTNDFAAVVASIRAALPHVSLSTDVIVGFPGETEAEFAETLVFCRSMAFSKLHVFRYSARPDTLAASMPDQVDPRVAQARSERLRALGDELRHADAAARVGSVERVLVEHVRPDGSASGTSASYHDVRLPAGAHGLAAPGLLSVRFVRMEGTALVGEVQADAAGGLGM